MHQTNFSPPLDRNWSEETTIGNFDASAEPRGTFAPELIPLRNLGQNRGRDFVRRQAPRPCLGRRSPSARRRVEPDEGERPAAVFPSRLRPPRLPDIGHSRESFARSGGGQVKMLNVPVPLKGRPSRRNRFDRVPQSSEMRVHAGYSPFAIFQLKCCRTNNLKKSYQEGCHENG